MLQREKIEQAVAIMKEYDIDMWITAGRETGMNNDPVIPFISTIDYTALMGLVITKSGESVALVGHNDYEGTRQTKVYNEVIGYDTSYSKELIKIINRFNPQNIALNYSEFDVAADGLSHGMHLKITRILKDNGSTAKVVSAERIIGALRGRKTSIEKDRIQKAINTTQQIYDDAKNYIKEGISEIDIYNFFQERMRYYDVEASWEASQCPGVMVGVSTVVGHNAPTGILVKKGDSITVDFGVRQYGYCSDLQRVYYVLRDDEKEAPEEVRSALEAIQEGVRRAAALMKPGAKVTEVDAAARDYIVSQGFPSWNYALGHEVGRFAHDGGLILAPNWERYEEEMLKCPLEEGMVFTLEPGIKTAHGFVGQEEVAIVGKNEGIILSKQQRGVYLI